MMRRRHPRSTRTATLCPDTTLCRSRDGAIAARAELQPGFAEFNPETWTPDYTLAELAQRGYRPLDPVASDATATLVSLEGSTGKQYRSEEHTSELQSLMRISSAVFCLKNKKHNQDYSIAEHHN